MSTALEQIDAATMKNDKICIERDADTGDISWNFSTKSMSPIELMAWAAFYRMLIDSGYQTRIEQLEAKVEELERTIQAIHLPG